MQETTLLLLPQFATQKNNLIYVAVYLQLSKRTHRPILPFPLLPQR